MPLSKCEREVLEFTCVTLADHLRSKHRLPVPLTDMLISSLTEDELFTSVHLLGKLISYLR